MADKKVQRTVTDLETLDEITLVKPVDFSPVASQADALARLNNDSKKFLANHNEGLWAEAQRQARGNPDGWHSLNDEGELNGPFDNSRIADPKAVNALVLILAKTSFGYTKDATAEQKKAARELAMDTIKSTPVIKEGLRKSAALKVEEDDSESASA